jgi:hypothetical protein
LSDVEALGQVEVETPEGEAVELASLWATRPVVIAFLRHFG